MHFLFGVLVLVLDILAIVHIVKSKAEDSKKILWIVLIVLLPIIGLILWYLLGREEASL
jgi:succinate dehydrogenase/fumarate reductase cytochrome b subunit